ncbi:hypothetical protein JOB18_000236 [Solea senegalensis]|uniref:Uncharacterized protein n=1 Tax=Solea senegalensis TaxID=28829 RepID=A0AAV6T281_SOLSE|nr:hypothetical protein JOB18_000236 [Solea senegalensis]
MKVWMQLICLPLSAAVCFALFSSCDAVRLLTPPPGLFLALKINAPSARQWEGETTVLIGDQLSEDAAHTCDLRGVDVGFLILKLPFCLHLETWFLPG